ncbi:MAG: hypothetical protein JST90_07160 [Bacteroidetes bacterium]|nr:hypothetical protein [Bacteroidota bacterium]
MKRIMLIAVVTFSLSSCGNHNHGAKANTNPSDSSSVKGAVYTCPMHEEIVSYKPGECPKCGMVLELKSN